MCGRDINSLIEIRYFRTGITYLRPYAPEYDDSRGWKKCHILEYNTHISQTKRKFFAEMLWQRSG